MGSRISVRRRIGLREFPSVLFTCDHPYGGDDGGGGDDDGLKLRKIKANEHSANAKNATSKTSS